MNILFFGDVSADHRIAGPFLLLLVEPVALGDPPPATHGSDTRVQLFSGGQFHMVVKPRALYIYSISAVQTALRGNKRGIVYYIEGPEDRLDLAQFVLSEVSAGNVLISHIVQGGNDRRVLGDDIDICAVCLELLIYLVSDIEHY